jgi:hypothetical protein
LLITADKKQAICLIGSEGKAYKLGWQPRYKVREQVISNLGTVKGDMGLLQSKN